MAKEDLTNGAVHRRISPKITKGGTLVKLNINLGENKTNLELIMNYTVNNKLIKKKKVLKY